MPTDSSATNCIALTHQCFISWSFFSVWADLALSPMKLPKRKLSECQLWLLSFLGGRYPFLKGLDGHHQLHVQSSPTQCVHCSAGQWTAGSAGHDCVELDSSRLLMGESPLNTSLRLHPSCFDVIKCMKQ